MIGEDPKYVFGWCEIKLKEKSSIILIIKKYLNIIQTTKMTKLQCSTRDAIVTSCEIQQYRALARICL